MENLCSWTFARILVRGPSQIFVRGPLFVHSSQHKSSLKQAHNFSNSVFITVGNCLGQSGCGTIFLPRVCSVNATAATVR